MFFPCPHCQFLVAYHPQSRPLPAQCPRCGRPLQEDIDTTPGTSEGPLDGQAQDSAAAVDAPMPGSGRDADAVPGEASIATEAQANPAAPAPPAGTGFAGRLHRRGWERWQWPLVALLALLLALQVLLADRANLAADPRWRPLVGTLCDALGCELPAWHEPTAFTMLDRKVRPEAGRPGALRVDATFRNDARWPQAWPALQLALSDADGRVLGSRVFAPGDYLGAEPGTLLSPGQSAQVTFLVQEPSPGTVAFSFEFR